MSVSCLDDIQYDYIDEKHLTTKISVDLRKLGCKGLPIPLEDWFVVKDLIMSMHPDKPEYRVQMPKASIVCATCFKVFYRGNRYIHQVLKVKSDTYCSKSCANGKHPSMLKKCPKCAKGFSSRWIERDNRYYRYCSIKCTRSDNTGEKSPSFKHGLTCTRTNPHNSRFFQRARPIVKERDGFQCVVCGDGKSTLDVHHINHDPKCNDVTNLVTLCGSCHNKHHSFCGRGYSPTKELWPLQEYAIKASDNKNL